MELKSYEKTKKHSKTRKKILLYLAMLVYGTSLLFYLLMIICPAYSPLVFPNNFNYFRLLNGLVWCTLLFFVIKYENRRASVFFLFLTLWFQIVPLAIVFAVCGGNDVFFNLACCGFLLCILFTLYVKRPVQYFNIGFTPNKLYTCCLFVVLFMFIIAATQNGIPSFKALNIYKVYEIRASGVFKISKYLGYILSSCITILIPALITKTMINPNDRNPFILSIFFIAIVFIFYLYSGYKVFLFSIPVVLVCSIWSQRDNFCSETLIFFSITMSSIVFFLCGNNAENSLRLFPELLSLIYRRVILVPARISFFYADYFSHNSLYGMHGLLPRVFIIGNPPYYEGFVIGREIGSIYLGQQTNASTGMLGDSVMHFGLPGVLFAWLVLAWILRQLDSLQERTNYRLVVGTFGFFIYSLSDAPFWGAMIAGPVMTAILFIFFYSKEKRHRLKAM